MGKKSKKLNNMVDLQLPFTNDDLLEQGNGQNLGQSKKDKNNCAATASSDDKNLIKNCKKNKRKHELNGGAEMDITAEQITEARKRSVDDEPDASSTLKLKKKRKKNRLLVKEQHPKEVSDIKNVSVTLPISPNDETLYVPKKEKKKKNKANLLVVEKVKQETVHDEVKEQKLKKKNRKDTALNEDELGEEKAINVKTKEIKTRSQKKKKTGTAVLNEAESQVTEEIIDKFCDELDEEHNQQYENWVRLLEASLPLPRKKK